MGEINEDLVNNVAWNISTTAEGCGLNLMKCDDNFSNSVSAGFCNIFTVGKIGAFGLERSILIQIINSINIQSRGQYLNIGGFDFNGSRRQYSIEIDDNFLETITIYKYKNHL